MRTKPRKPSALKRLEGRVDRRFTSENEPRPLRSGEPDAPAWLTPHAREEWTRCIGELAKMGVVAKIDAVACAAYCEAYSRWRVAEEVVESMAAADPVTRGLLMRMPGGSAVGNPAIYLANAARRDLLRAAAEIGMSPSSRAHLEAIPDEDADAIWSKYFPGQRR